MKAHKYPAHRRTEKNALAESVYGTGAGEDGAGAAGGDACGSLPAHPGGKRVGARRPLKLGGTTEAYAFVP